MREPIERMRKLINDNLVMGLRFQMNRELNKLESEIEQELDSRAERTCDLLKQRIAELESLVLYMYNEMYGCKYYHDCGFCEFDKCIFEKRMAELGLLRGDAE